MSLEKGIRITDPGFEFPVVNAGNPVGVLRNEIWANHMSTEIEIFKDTIIMEYPLCLIGVFKE